MVKVRLFKCTHCGHKLRVGTSQCSVCWGGTPVMNRPWYAVGMVLVVVMILILVAAIM